MEDGTGKKCFIPSVVNTLILSGHAGVKVLRTPDSWFRVTCREDRLRAIQGIWQLIEQSVCPEKLWLWN